MDDVVDLESVPGGCRRACRRDASCSTSRGRRTTLRRCDTTGMYKERERMSWDEAREFLTSTGAWLSP